jgi:hypothetical protein
MMVNGLHVVYQGIETEALSTNWANTAYFILATGDTVSEADLFAGVTILSERRSHTRRGPNRRGTGRRGWDRTAAAILKTAMCEKCDRELGRDDGAWLCLSCVQAGHRPAALEAS